MKRRTFLLAVAAVTAPLVGEAQQAGGRVAVEYFSAARPEDVSVALASVTRLGMQGLIVSADAVIRGRALEITDFAMRNRLPAVYFANDYVRTGGLLSYGPNPRGLGRRAATYVDKILKGAKPADLPVEEPTSFDLAINLKTAKAIGLAIPQSLLLRADEIIQ